MTAPTANANTRRERFDAAVEDADDKQLSKAISFTEHRFVTIERDALTVNRYAKGHKTLRGACGYLARVVEEGEPMVPEKILDLDSGEEHEVALYVHVAPKSMDAVSMLLPRDAAQAALDAVTGMISSIEVDVPGASDAAHRLIKQAIDRRH